MKGFKPFIVESKTTIYKKIVSTYELQDDHVPGEILGLIMGGLHDVYVEYVIPDFNKTCEAYRARVISFVSELTLMNQTKS